MIRALPLVLLTAIATRGQGFDAASIRLHPPDVGTPVFKNPDVNPIQVSGHRVTLQMVNLKSLIMAAYSVKEYQVSGGPRWATEPGSMYDIVAETAGDAPQSMDQVRLSLRSLLAERFQLKLRSGSKEFPVYNLVVAKNGSKLKRASETAAATHDMRRGSMDQLAALLSLMLDRPVIDRTGLAGIYEFSDGLTRLDTGAQDSPDVVATTLTAIQETLGLRAQPAKATLEMLVIESAEKPSEN